MYPAHQHELRNLKDAVRDPRLYLLGGLNPERAKQELKTRFGYSDRDIRKLRKGEK